jgi:hypothetical protein
MQEHPLEGLPGCFVRPHSCLQYVADERDDRGRPPEVERDRRRFAGVRTHLPLGLHVGRTTGLRTHLPLNLYVARFAGLRTHLPLGLHVGRTTGLHTYLPLNLYVARFADLRTHLPLVPHLRAQE